MTRFDFNNLYNVTVECNKDVKIFIDQVLVFEKTNKQKNGQLDINSFQIEAIQYQMMHFEVFISDQESEVEPDGSKGYFRMFENSGNTLKRIWRPKNMFQVQQIIGSNV